MTPAGIMKVMSFADKSLNASVITVHQAQSSHRWYVLARI